MTVRTCLVYQHSLTWGHEGTANGTLFCRGWDTILSRWDTKWDINLPRWDTKGHQRTQKWCPASLWSSARPVEGYLRSFRALRGRKPGSRSQKLTRSRFAIPAGCGILLSTSFQPCKGGDMVCVRIPLGAYESSRIIRNRKEGWVFRSALLPIEVPSSPPLAEQQPATFLRKALLPTPRFAGVPLRSQVLFVASGRNDRDIAAITIREESGASYRGHTCK